MTGARRGGDARARDTARSPRTPAHGARHGALAQAWLAAAPAVFVVLWSTGYVGARLGLPYAEPMTFLTLRFALVTATLAVAALLLRLPWPRRPADLLHAATAGLLIQAGYLGGVFAAVAAGVQIGIAALVVGLQPLLTAALAVVWLREPLTRRQGLGLLLGACGAALVIARKLDGGLGSELGLALAVVGLVAITVGTLYQKRFCTHLHLVTGNAVQFAAATLATGALALALESRAVQWTPGLVFALAWLALVLSIGAVSVLYSLIRRGAAARVASLFYLVPPVTALLGWLLFDERIGPTAVAGMALAAAGVGLVHSPARPR